MPAVLPSDWQMLGWAGLLLPLPAAFVPAQIQGDYRSGRMLLSAGGQARLQILWGRVLRRRFDAQAFTSRHLLQSAAGDPGKPKRTAIKTLDHPGFAPLLSLQADKGPRRFAGYCPATRRVIELAYSPGEPGEDQLFYKAAIPAMRDQPLENPQYWSFFRIRFTSPALFSYRNAVLNLGDMSLRLTATAPGRRKPQLWVRFLYPASLALARQNLDAWLNQTMADDRRYRPQLPRSRGTTPEFAGFQTPLGAGLSCDSRLPIQHRLLRYRTPVSRRTWVVHDTTANRLLCVQANAPLDQCDHLITTILENLDWRSAP